MDYKASLDITCKAITIGVLILFVAIGQGNFRAILRARGSFIIIGIHGAVLLLLLTTAIGSYLYSPRGYTVTATDLIIRRPIKDRIIKLADVAEIRATVPGELSGTIRTFGVGGLFGYFGGYYDAQLGNMTWYVTQQRNSVLIRTIQGDKIIISPDDISLVDKAEATVHSALSPHNPSSPRPLS